MILARMGDGFVELDEKGTVLGWSEGIEEMLGWSRAETEGRELAALILPDSSREAYAEAFSSCLLGKQTAEVELELSPRDGRSLFARLLFYYVGSETASVSVGVRRLEDRKEQTRRRLDHKRLESLGLFAGGIAHDFNDLLLTVIGNATLAKRDLPPESPLSDRLAQIEQAAKKAAELTGQILAFAGRASFRAERIDLDRLLERALEELRPLTREADVRLEIEKQPVHVQADPNQLRQLLANLISNAIESLADPSGVVRVRAGEIEVDPDALHLYYLGEGIDPGLYAFLEVVDEGCGMDSGTQVRMFEPFFSTKFAGRGLGLPAVLGIVRAHGGTLNIYSEPGLGTRVRVLLPLTNKVTSRAPHHEQKQEDRGVVVIADDEAAVRRVTLTMLEEAGYRVMLARNGREAVDLVAQYKDEVKVLLLDMTMPTMSGEEAVHLLREIGCPVPVILSSGLIDLEAVARLGAHDPKQIRVLQKPFRRAELLGMLQEIAV
ncbi:MAG: ATP-binding protein [Gaiellaceae bacterium]